MHLYDFYHRHRARRLSVSDFWTYELSMWLHTLAHSLTSIFIPILMLKSGFTIPAVIGYYVLYNVLDVPLNFLARAIVARFGARFVIAIATIAVIIFFSILLTISSPSIGVLILLAIFGALYDALYWVAHIFLFIGSYGAAKRTGKSTGILYAIRQCALMLGPVIGAALLVFFDERALLLAVVAFFILSLYPLGKVDEFPDVPASRPLAAKYFFAAREGKRTFLSVVLYAVHDTAESVIFPVFIYITFGTLQSVALVPIVMSLAAMVIALILGNVHPNKRGFAIAAGASAIALIWLVRLYLGSPTIYYGSIFVIGILAYFVLVPLDSLIFEYGRAVHDPLSASMYRNIAFMGSNVVFYGILAIFVSIFTPGFALAAAALLGLFIFTLAQFLLPNDRGVR
jgi:hypothetical protein